MHNLKLKNMKFKNLIDDIVIIFNFLEILQALKYIIRKSNVIVNLSKFTINKKLNKEFERFLFKLCPLH